MSTSRISPPLITLTSKITKSRFRVASFAFLSNHQPQHPPPLKFFVSFTHALCFVHQMRPTYHPEGLFDDNKVASFSAPKERANPINQLWHQNGKCPESTIPIRRTKGDDVLRASSVKRYGKKKQRTVPQPRSVDPDLINQSGHQVKFLCLFPSTVLDMSFFSTEVCSVLALWVY